MLGGSDDDIQYLGTKPAPSRTSLDFTSFSAHRPVTGTSQVLRVLSPLCKWTQRTNDHTSCVGIALHIEGNVATSSKDGGVNRIAKTPASAQGLSAWDEVEEVSSSHGMVFRKAASSVVHIGRRPTVDGAGAVKEGGDDASAMFRCAVVSRLHAKVVFTDSGNVSLFLSVLSLSGSLLVGCAMIVIRSSSLGMSTLSSVTILLITAHFLSRILGRFGRFEVPSWYTRSKGW